MANVHTFDAHHKVQLLIPPASQGDLNTAYVEPFADGGGADRAVFMLVTGVMANTTDFKLTQANTAGGGGAKDITGAAIVQLTVAQDESICTIEIGPGALDGTNGFKWVRGELLVGGADVGIWAVVYIRHRLRYPGVGGQHASYRQQVVVI